MSTNNFCFIEKQERFIPELFPNIIYKSFALLCNKEELAGNNF